MPAATSNSPSHHSSSTSSLLLGVIEQLSQPSRCPQIVLKMSDGDVACLAGLASCKEGVPRITHRSELPVELLGPGASFPSPSQTLTPHIPFLSPSAPSISAATEEKERTAHFSHRECWRKPCATHDPGIIQSLQGRSRFCVSLVCGQLTRLEEPLPERKIFSW